MASLTGQTIASSFDSLLKVTDNGPLTSSLKLITDGLGNNSALSLSTVGASITGTLSVSSTLTASNFSGTFNGTFSGTSSNTNTGDETNATIKSKLGIATTSVDGYLTSTDWTTFNNKVATTRSISTTSPLAGGGDLSANRTLSIAQATTSTDGYLSSTDWTTFNGKESALTFSAPLSRATNTISIPAATTSVSGHLTSTDWTTFNAKVGGSGTTNYVPKLTGASTIGNSQIFDNGSGVGIGTTNLGGLKLTVNGNTQFIGSTFATGTIQANQNLDIGGTCHIGSLGDGDYVLIANSGGVSVTGSFGCGSIECGGINNNNGGITNAGALSGVSSLSMGGGLSGVTSLSMTGSLTGATNITASGTLNVGSTTTATKRLELTADNGGAAENNTLRFVNTDTSISANEVIGKIEFFSNDVTAPGGTVKAYISANALDTSPDAYLDFATDQVTGTPIVRQRIQADGKVLFGTTTPITNNTNLVQVNGGLDYNIIMRGSSGTAITLGLNDKGSFFECSGTSAIAVTIPTNSAVAFPIGTQIWFVQTTLNGIPTFTPDTGVTLRTRSVTRQPLARYSEVKLTKSGTDEWYLTGDLKA